MTHEILHPPVSAGNVPDALRADRQWILWRYEGPDQRKVLCQVNGCAAKTNDASTWTTLDEALAAYAANPKRWCGIGYVFRAGGGKVGVDFDDCLDPETGEPDPRVASIIGELNTYTEISPSGKGIKCWAIGAELPNGINRGWSEMYSSGRFFCFTGQRFAGSPDIVNDATEALARHYGRLTAEARPTATQPPKPHNGHSRSGALDRCRKYLNKLPPALPRLGIGKIGFAGVNSINGTAVQL